MMPKVDGAHALVVLESGRRPRVFSYRESKRGDVLEYTHKIPGLFSQKVPKGVGKVVLRAEVFLSDKSGGAMPPGKTAGVLNAGVLKARKMQEGTGGLKIMPFDVVSDKDMSDEKRVAKLKALTAQLPFLMDVDVATTPEEKLRMIRSIKGGKSKLTKEGVVLWTDEGPTKAKAVDDADVYVRSVFRGKGKYSDSAGGFTYSLTPDGPIIGKVGGGLSDKQRRELWAAKDSVEGRVAKVVFNRQTSSGRLFAPRFVDWHVDKNM
jgi:hypothetical protein